MLENVMQKRIDAELQSYIRERAYRLYEIRGRVDGLDWQDWFNAERDIFDELNHPADIASRQEEQATVRAARA